MTNAETGQPLRKARVTVSGSVSAGDRRFVPSKNPAQAAAQAEAMRSLSRVYSTLTDAEGKLLIQGIDPGRYGVRAERDGFAAATHGPKRWGPRTIDLDLLLYDDIMIASERLTVPHPRMHARAFVLIPLLEIASDIVVPGQGSAAELLGEAGRQGVERV